MNGNLVKAQDTILEKVNNISRDFGLNNIMTQLYIILYFSHKPLSLNNMMERLEISKSSVSVNIRALEHYGAVKRIWIKGSRRDYYEAELDISKVALDRIKAMLGRQLNEIEKAVSTTHKIADSITPENKEEKESVNVFKERMSELKKLYDKAKYLLTLFNTDILNT